MAFYTTYRIEFKNNLDRLCRVDIQENLGSQPQIIELIPTVNPVIFQLPDLSDTEERVMYFEHITGTSSHGDNTQKLFSFSTVYDPKVKVYGVDNQYIKLSLSAKFIARDYIYEGEEPEDYLGFGHIILKYKVKIGDKYYYKNTETWSTSSSNYGWFNHNEFPTNKEANFENQWVDLEEYIPVDSSLNGNLVVEIYDWIYAGYEDDNTQIPIDNPSEGTIRHVLIKNIKAEPCQDTLGTKATDDIKTTGYFDENYKRKFEITMKLGDSSADCMTHRGGLLVYNEDRFATDFYRGTQASRYNLNELLCKLYSAETQEARFQINAKVTADEIMWASATPLNQIATISIPTESGRVFMLSGGEYNARTKELDAQFLEVYNESTVNY